MNFLITGITGFVGPHLAKLLLAEGHTVCGLLRGANGRQYDLLDVMDPTEIDSIRWLIADLKDWNSIRKALDTIPYKLDGVFHCAAQSHPPTSFDNPIMTFNDNVMGSVNLIECIIEKYEKSCKFHFCSTSEVYGDTCKDKGILKETDSLSPSNPYACSKASIEYYLLERIKNKKIQGFITRSFSHTGNRRGKNFSISSDAYQLANMVTFIHAQHVLHVGNLETERVVIDVKDVCQAYYRLMLNEQSNGEIYNVCGKTIHKMQYFTDKLIEFCAKYGLKDVQLYKSPKLYRPIDIQIQIGDCNKIKTLIEWEPTIPIEDTLNNLLYYWLLKLNKE